MADTEKINTGEKQKESCLTWIYLPANEEKDIIRCGLSIISNQSKLVISFIKHRKLKSEKGNKKKKKTYDKHHCESRQARTQTSYSNPPPMLYNVTTTNYFIAQVLLIPKKECCSCEKNVNSEELSRSL